MQALLSIENDSNHIVSESRKANFVFSVSGFLLNFLNAIVIKIKQRLTNYLDSLILTLEGFLPHIETLSSEIATKELKATKKVLEQLIKVNEKFEEINYLDDDKFKEKYLHSLKLLYQTESKLHKAVYKNKPVEKTPNELIDGIMKMNNNYVNELLSL